jgi:putative flavoprotein involved in K+ transport
MTERYGTVIVGAGPAGVATSAALAAAGHDHVVLERGRIGESWRSQRWDAFRLNTPGWMNGLPDADGFGTAADLIASLEARAEGLPIREGMPVHGVWRERGGGYRVAAGDETLLADTVVAASGAQCLPRLPAIAQAVSGRRVEHLHTGDYRNAAALPPGDVLVIGSGQSGLQIADDLAAAGRRVLLSTSRVGRMPRRHRGRDTTEWWRDMGLLDAPAASAADAQKRARSPQVAGGRDLRLQDLAARGVRLLGRLAEADGPRLRFDDSAAEHVAYADRRERAVRERIDAWIAAHGIDAPPHEPADDGRPPATEPAMSLDLRIAGVGSIIWATGFTGDFTWLKMPILGTDGRPLHRNGATPSAGLYVVGLPWLTRRSSGMLHGLMRDAQLVAAQITRTSERVATAG